LASTSEQLLVPDQQQTEAWYKVLLYINPQIKRWQGVLSTGAERTPCHRFFNGCWKNGLMKLSTFASTRW